MARSFGIVSISGKFMDSSAQALVSDEQVILPAPGELRAEIEQDWPAHINQSLAHDLEQLLKHGFELLADLTGKAPKSFDGLYQGWYTQALSVVDKLAPLRMEEFRSLYRWPARRKPDFETFGIRDYLLGMSLHGGFGGIDVTRGIVARRFHQQLMILKIVHLELKSRIGRIHVDIAIRLVLRQLELARQRQNAGDHRAASLIIIAGLQTLIEELGLHGRLSKGGKINVEKLIAQLMAAKTLNSAFISTIEQIDETIKNIARAHGCADESHFSALVDAADELVGLLGSMDPGADGGALN